MLEQNLRVYYAGEQSPYYREIDSIEDVENLKNDSNEPTKIVYSIESDYPINFQNELLEQLNIRYPEVPIRCVHLKNNQELCNFNWRVKKAFIDTANSLKVMSKCTRLKVCCLVVKNNRIISTGVNGTPKGFKNCSEVFSVQERLTKGYYEKHHIFSEAYEVHAEMNAIIELGRNTSIDSYADLELFCSTCPCPNCAKMIAQAGIKKVYYSEAYDRQPEGAKNLQAFGIEVYQL